MSYNKYSRCVMRLPIKFHFQKKYIAFFAIVPLLTTTALVKVNCPVCEGNGYVFSTPGIENVRLINVDSQEKSVLRDACGMFIMYNYDVMLSLMNDGSDTAVGWVKMVLIDFSEGKVLDTQYTVVEVAGGTSLDVAYNIWFKTGLDEPLKTEVNALVLHGEVPDITCDGTGKISINTWFLVKNLKNSFQEMSRVEKPIPPILPIQWTWTEGE